MCPGGSRRLRAAATGNEPSCGYAATWPDVTAGGSLLDYDVLESVDEIWLGFPCAPADPYRLGRRNVSAQYQFRRHEWAWRCGPPG